MTSEVKTTSEVEVIQNKVSHVKKVTRHIKKNPIEGTVLSGILKRYAKVMSKPKNPIEGTALSGILKRYADVKNQPQRESAESEEEEDDSDDVFVGTHKQGETPTPAIANSSTVIKKTVVKETQQKTKVIGQREPTNEIPVVGSDYQSSEFETEGEEEDTEGDAIENLLGVIRSYQDKPKLEMIKKLFKFIDSQVKKDHGSFIELVLNPDLLNFDINTTKCFVEIQEDNFDSESVNSRNCLALLMAIMYSDKKKNFDWEKFHVEHKTKNPALSSRNIKSKELEKFMRKPCAKLIFSMFFERIISSSTNKTEKKSKVLMSHSISTCLVNEDNEDTITDKIVCCMNNEANTKPAKKQLKVDDDDVEKIEEKKTKPQVLNKSSFTEKQNKGLQVIQRANDVERMKYCNLLMQYLEKLSKSNVKLGTLYILSVQPDSKLITELMSDIVTRNKVPQSASAEVAYCLLMQMLRTRPEENLNKKMLKEIDTNSLDSDQLRNMIKDDSCQDLYDAIFNHMVIIIDDGNSNIKHCAEYLTEAIVNHKRPTAIEKKYVENCIHRSMEREVTKKSLNKSANISDKMNKQFHSPTSSQEEAVVGLKKSKGKNKKMAFELDDNDFGLDDADKQAINDYNEGDIQDGESFEF